MHPKIRLLSFAALAMVAGAFCFTARAATNPDPLVQQLKVDGLAQQVLATKIKTELTTLGSQVDAQNASVATLTTANASLNSSNTSLRAVNTSLAASNVTLTKKVADLMKQLGTTAPPTTAEILAALTDYSAAGVSKRLGPTYAELHPTPEVFPTIWVRPLVPIVLNVNGRVSFSEGLGKETTAPYDYASTEGQLIYAPDLPNLAVDRVRTNESAGGVVTVAAQFPWNMGPARPDPDLIWWAQRDGRTLAKPVAIARAHLLQANCGLMVFSDGFIATVNTVTGHATFAGIQLPADKIPLSICLTSQNEFALIGVHDKTTGKGQLCVVSLYGAGTEANPQWTFYHDWAFKHPGLMNAGVWDGAKILGYVDLGITFPTAVSAVGEANLAKDRIEGADGNAGVLRDYDLNTQAGRDKFLEKNGDWISRWGQAVAISKPEGKAVFVDFTPLFKAMRAAYFSTQAEYDETKSAGWPYTFTERPIWTPQVIATVAVAKPSAVLVSESGTGEAAVASESGTVTFYTRAGAADGSVTVGQNPTCLNYVKYHGGIRTGGFLAVCRGDRSVVWVNKSGAGATVTRTLRDVRLLDPVFAESQDTHGIEMDQIAVCDFAGKKLETYRASDLYFGTQGGAVIPVKDGAQFEGNPSFAVPGQPFTISTSNVN